MGLIRIHEPDALIARHLVPTRSVLQQLGAQLEIRPRSPLPLGAKIVGHTPAHQFIEQPLQRLFAAFPNVSNHQAELIARMMPLAQPVAMAPQDLQREQALVEG